MYPTHTYNFLSRICRNARKKKNYMCRCVICIHIHLCIYMCTHTYPPEEPRLDHIQQAVCARGGVYVGVRTTQALNHWSLLQKSPIKQTLFCNRDLYFHRSYIYTRRTAPRSHAAGSCMWDLESIDSRRYITCIYRAPRWERGVRGCGNPRKRRKCVCVWNLYVYIYIRTYIHRRKSAMTACSGQLRKGARRLRKSEKES